MKKSIWITIISIIAIISLMFVFMACNKDGEETPTTPDTKSGELENTDFFTAAFNVENPKIIISLISVADNKEIYNRSSNGTETNPYALEIDGGSYIDAATAFEYREDAFSETSIKSRIFTGTVENPKDYLGVTDANTTISNAKVVIELTKTNALKSIDVTFDMTVDDIAFKATITINP